MTDITDDYETMSNTTVNTNVNSDFELVSNPEDQTENKDTSDTTDNTCKTDCKTNCKTHCKESPRPTRAQQLLDEQNSINDAVKFYIEKKLSYEETIEYFFKNMCKNMKCSAERFLDDDTQYPLDIATGVHKKLCEHFGKSFQYENFQEKCYEYLNSKEKKQERRLIKQQNKRYSQQH